MSRCYINNSGGDTFFAKFRNRFASLQCELHKLENVMNDSDNLCSVYSFETVSMLTDVDTIYNELLNLYNGVIQEKINIDPIENKLLSIRERLIKFEENPELLKRGYVAYVPPQPEPSISPERIEEDNIDADDSNMNNTIGNMQSDEICSQDCEVQLTEIFSHNNQNKNTAACQLVEPMDNLAINGTGKSIDQTNRFDLDIDSSEKKPVRKLNPKLFPGLANAFSKIDRWRSVNHDSDFETESKPIKIQTTKKNDRLTRTGTKPIGSVFKNGQKNSRFGGSPQNVCNFNELASNSDDGDIQQTDFIGTPNLRPRPTNNNTNNNNLFPSLQKKLVFSTAKKSVIPSTKYNSSRY